MNDLKSYSAVIEHLHKPYRPHHLLLGNGFSIAYDRKIFSYNALNQTIMQSKEKELKEIFNIFNTQNFELVMQQLDNFGKISKVLKAPDDFVAKIANISTKLKDQLIDAITLLHPEQVFDVPEKESKSCASFINEYLDNSGHVFSTNYDLLLYWILMRNSSDKCIDGFGRDAENFDDGTFVKEEDIEYSELRWGKHKEEQNVHYLHGALPIFDDGIDIIKEEYDQSSWLLDKIKERITKGQYPVFVTAGNGDQKLNHIMHNSYLSFCYDKLCNIVGSLIVFGFGFGDYDKHIIKAINIAAKKKFPRLNSVYIGIFSEADYEHIQAIRPQIKCKVNFYDAKTANIWAKQ